MDLKREVPVRASRSSSGNFFHVTKILALIVGLASGIPLGMIYAFQTGLHKSCQTPLVVKISEVRTSPDPELDAHLAAKRYVRTMTECKECHPLNSEERHLTLSDMELCLTDNPTCKWVYDIDAGRRIRRRPNWSSHPVRVITRPSRLIRIDSKSEPTPSMPFPDILQYESF